MQVAPSQMSPAESFDVFYFIRNHTDGTTYYVRAVVYDVRTGEVITTVNLEQSATNARLFIKTLQAPPDPVGMGRNIVAIATVYTDSSYTTKSQEAMLPSGGGGGGVDWTVMRDLINDVLDKRLKDPEGPRKISDMPFDGLFETLGTFGEQIDKLPKDGVDLKPVMTAFSEVMSAIAAIEKPEKVDLAPLMTLMQSTLDAVKALPTVIDRAGDRIAKENQAAYKKLAAKIIEDAEKGLQGVWDKQEVTIPLSKLIQKKSDDATEKEVDPMKEVGQLM